MKQCWTHIYSTLWLCVIVCLCSFVQKVQTLEVFQLHKSRGIKPWFFFSSFHFYPLINMTEGRVTAPEKWTQPPVPCCGQRARHYPQCNTGRFHQRHNATLTPCSYSIGLRLSSRLFVCFTINSSIWFWETKTNKCSRRVFVQSKTGWIYCFVVLLK